MATWIYEARTADGRIVRGTSEATDRRAALDALRAQGLFINRLEARGAANKAAPLRPRAPVASAPDVVAPRRESANETNRRVAPPIVASGDAATDAVAAQKSVPRVPTFNPDLTAPAAPPLDPTVLRPMGQMTSAPLVKQPFLRASNQDLSNFFRQLAALIHAGTGIGAALGTLAENVANRSLRAACEQMSKRAQTGEAVSQSMEAFPGLFTPLMIGITRAGERGGFLESSFNRLADYSERDYKLEQSIKQETWYPKTVFFFSFAIGAVPTLFLQGFVPFLRQIFPPYALIALGFLGWKGWNLVRPALIAGAIEPLRIGSTSPAKIYDEIKLMLPVAGKTARALASAKFCRALAALYSAGVSPGEAVRLGAQACGNRAVAERALKTIPDLQNGRSLTQCMKETRVFNPLALQMMRVGEESGDLDSQLDKAADFLESNAETTIKQAVPVLGILIFLCVAAYVLVQMVSFYTGYFNDIFQQAEAV